MRGLAGPVGGFIGALVVTTAVVSAGPQSEPYSGGGDYQVYCSACHGAGGKGDGSIAKSLKKIPSDLTQLSKQNTGVFPIDKVFKTIEGHGPGSAHDSDMPAWGDVFAKSSESQGSEKAAMRIRTLVKYLETLQAK